MRHPIAKFYSDERGATSIEYGLIATVLGLGLVVSLTNLETALNGILTAVSAPLK